MNVRKVLLIDGDADGRIVNVKYGNSVQIATGQVYEIRKLVDIEQAQCYYVGLLNGRKPTHEDTLRAFAKAPLHHWPEPLSDGEVMSELCRQSVERDNRK